MPRPGESGAVQGALWAATYGGVVVVQCHMPFLAPDAVLVRSCC